jgi:hypothetical protein
VNRYYVAEERAALAQRLERQASCELVRAAELEARRDDLPPERRFDPACLSFLGHGQAAPTLHEPTSQLCTENQLREPIYRAWCEELGEPVRLHRKLWEYAYILQALAVRDLLAPGRRGLGFRCYREPLTAVMATRGCEIVAAGDAHEIAGDGVDGSRSRSVEDLSNVPGLCDPDLFHRRVARRAIDMSRMSADLETFDFVFSTGALARRASIGRGAQFVIRSMRLLKRDGLAVHVTDFNLSSNDPTLEAPDGGIYRRCDIEALIADVERAGHAVHPLNLNAGNGPVDRYVDLPPYRPEPHLRLRAGRHVVTSLGLIIRKL